MTLSSTFFRLKLLGVLGLLLSLRLGQLTVLLSLKDKWSTYRLDGELLVHGLAVVVGARALLLSGHSLLLPNAFGYPKTAELLLMLLKAGLAVPDLSAATLDL